VLLNRSVLLIVVCPFSFDNCVICRFLNYKF
jgi:hypothetical protein